MNEILKAAKYYISRGWYIIPLYRSIPNEESAKTACTCGLSNCVDSGKHPAIETGVKGASNEEAKITEWFEGRSDRNIGIVTGEKSGITVIDIDTGIKGGEKTWNDLIAESGEPVTLMAKTGSGGIHAFFQYNSSLSTSSNTLGNGVDVRNDEGYVVAPPSNHKSGGSYEWLNEEKIAPLPKYLTKKKERRGRPRKDDITKKKYSIEEVRRMLKFVDAESRDMWRAIGIILGREFQRSDEAWEIYHEWADFWQGKKSRNHESIMNECFHTISQIEGESEYSMGTLVKAALDGGWTPKGGEVPLEHFLYYAPQNNFIYRPTGQFWPIESVNYSCTAINEDGKIIKPSEYIRRTKLITSMTKEPLIQEEVKINCDAREGIIVDSKGASLYNAYRSPTIEPGVAEKAEKWVNHVKLLFNKVGDADAFFNYLAHRRQQPGVKPRFSLLIAGEQGVGKDTAISMTYPAFGQWNIANIEPSALDSGFNEYASAVLVVISEAANHQDMTKWAFNEKLKVLISGTPDYVSVNPKYGQKYFVRLHCGVILTTNHLLEGLYIPPDDRRYDVLAAASKIEMGLGDPVERGAYFAELWHWYTEEEGAAHIAAYLQERDISVFDAASGQRLTDAHREVVASGLAPDAWLQDMLEELARPEIILGFDLWEVSEQLFPGEMTRNEFNRRVPHPLARAGYLKLQAPEQLDGRFSITREGKRYRTNVYYDSEKLTKSEAFKRWKKHAKEKF